jgi:3-dehydroquinate dehydratase/shikimate dehydrogenase
MTSASGEPIPSFAGRSPRRLAEVVASVDPRRPGWHESLGGRSGALRWLRVAPASRDVPHPDFLRAHFRGSLIFACPDGDRPEEASRERDVRHAAGLYDLVELNANRDLTQEVLAGVPPEKRLVTWRGTAASSGALAERFRWLATTEARYYRLIVDGDGLCAGLTALEFLHGLGRDDVVAYAAGEAGLWSRVLAPQYGAPLVFAVLGDGSSECGEPPSRKLIEDFGLPEVAKAARLFAIIGGSVTHSLSPRLHNAAYRWLGLPALFVPIPFDAFGEFWRVMVAGGALERIGLPLGGLTVASPHKADAATLVDVRGPVAERAGAANLLYRAHGRWVAESSDPPGVLEALGRRGLVCAARRAAVVGCGGSGRAVAVALRNAGIDVTLANRSRDRGRWAADRLDLPFVPLSDFSAAEFDLIVHATPIGRFEGDVPFDLDGIGASTVIVDFVYTEGTTPLVALARARGATVVDGREVLMIQAMRQFARMTGYAMPEPLAAELVGLGEACHLGEKQR